MKRRGGQQAQCTAAVHEADDCESELARRTSHRGNRRSELKFAERLNQLKTAHVLSTDRVFSYLLTYAY